MPDHDHPLTDTEERWLEDITRRGDGDPDYHGHYPNDPDSEKCELCHPKVTAKNTNNGLELINQK